MSFATARTPTTRFAAASACRLLTITAHEAGQGDCALFHRHCDGVRLDVRIPAEFAFDITLDLAVGSHRIPTAIPDELDQSR